MLIVSPSTAQALAPHAADRAWVFFLQVNPPQGHGPILIEGSRGVQISSRLRQLAADNPFETMLIGLIESSSPAEHAAAIGEQYATHAHLHDGWYEPTSDLLAFIQHTAQSALQTLLAQTHPAAVAGDALVDIEEMARLIGVSVPTVRRMVKANEIPYLKWGRVYRFVPADVIASLQRR